MAESYENLLYDLQKNNKTPLITHLLPKDNQIHVIDMNTRTIDVPQFLSVRFDHNAEVIYFKCARYFEGVDLADTICVIQFINANGDEGLYWVPYYDINHYDIDPEDPAITTPMLLFPWAIGGLATLKEGKVQFSVRFYRFNEDTKQFLFNVSTKPATGQILHGLDIPADADHQFQLDTAFALELQQKMFELAGEATTYWQDV